MSVIDISPYKFNKPLGSGQADNIHILDFPDVYNGKHQGEVEDDEVGRKYAEDAIEVMDNAVAKGRKVSLQFSLADFILYCT